MLSSITPLGERGRQSRWWITVCAFAFGATAAGALTGAAAGLLGEAVRLGSTSPRLRLGLLAAAALLGGGLELGRGLPGPRRQVDERWLDRYRGWVYGVGYGAQLGVGISTVVTSAATYLALVAALLSADPGRGALIVGLYGAIRGLTPLAGAHVRAPEQLFALHRRLGRGRARIARAGVAAIAAIAILALIGSLR